MSPAAAALALPLATEIGKAGLQLAQTPVLGWERVVTYQKGRKRPKAIVERSSVSVRAWELALLGGVGLVAWAVLRPSGPGSTGHWLADAALWWLPRR